MSIYVNIPFSLVKSTPFESLAAKINADNKIRNRQLEVLESIMITYSYIMCVLESNPRPITSEDVRIIASFITDVMVAKNKKIKEAAGYNTSFDLEEYFSNSYIWANTRYKKDYKENGGNITRYSHGDTPINKSDYWQNWREQNPEAKKDLTFYRLQEDLWDQEKGEFRYDKLPDFVKNYPWVFPPNVVELHKEMVALGNTEAPA